MRSHARYRAVGVGSRQLELDVAVELFEALLAAQLRTERTSQPRQQAVGVNAGARSTPPSSRLKQA